MKRRQQFGVKDNQQTQISMIINASNMNMELQYFMKRYVALLSLVLLLLSLSNCEDYTDLRIEDSRSISLNPTSPKYYRIVVPANFTHDSTHNQDLYIHVHPTLADPFQVPHLTLTANKGYQQRCYNAHQQFAGICKIDAAQLKPKRQFLLTIKCVTDCTLDLQTYLSNIITLALGQELNLHAKDITGLAVAILVEVPMTADYSQLCLLATITNVELNTPTDEKLDMLVNYGAADTPVPNDDNYTIQGLPLFTGGRGLYLSRNDTPPGSWITVYLRLQQNVSVTFCVREMLQGNSQITIGSSYFEYIDKQHLEKIYYVNLRATVPTLSNATIEIVFAIYSGDPKIEIGFDGDFQQQVPFTRQSSAISYSISPSLRQNYNFTDTLYIRVTVTLPSEYYFYTRLDRADATYMQPYLAYLDEISKDEVENYFLIERFSIPEDNFDSSRNYAFKIDTIKGYGSFYFRRCLDLELQSNSSQTMDLDRCLILDARELRNASFKREQIQNDHVKNGNKMSILMNYDVSNCSDMATKDGVAYKECAFQILALGESYEPFIFSITAERKYAISYLRENAIVKDFIYKDNYVYYAFSLPSIENVSKIEIVLTTFSGEAALIVSTVEHYPTFRTQLDLIQTQTGEKSSIVLEGGKLANDLYISVYAYQFTEVNLAVIVHRASDTVESNLNTLVLEKDSLLTYTLDSTHSSVSFKFNSRDSGSIVVSLNELAGHCSFKVFDLTNMQLSCLGKKDNALVCQVNTEQDTDYRIEVSGAAGKSNKFTISYKNSIQDCTAATLNLPIDVVLHADENECFTFPINRNVGLKFAASLTYAQSLNQQVFANLYANGQILSQIIGNHYDITISSMIPVCPLNPKMLTFASTCMVTVDFISNSNVTSHFNFIVQQADAEVALFDGIVQKSRDQNVGGKVSYFYYHLYSSRPLRVFFTSQSLRIAYTLVGQIVDKATYLSRHQTVNMYKDYLDQMYSRYNGSNLFATTGNYGTSILGIDGDLIKTHCPSEDCYLLISIASQDTFYMDSINDDGTREDISYEIEVTQEETYLPLGDTKLGFIERNEVYVYLLDPSDAYLTVTNMNKEGAATTTCATLFTSYDENGRAVQYPQLHGNYQMMKSDGIRQVFLRGDTDQCSYQISYTSLIQPVKNVRLSTLYDLSLQARQTEAYLFYNKHPSSFRILQMMSAGKADIYILPFTLNDTTLDAVFKLDHTTFPVIDNVDGDFIVSSTSQHFCWDCFYYVVVSTKQKFIGQIVFLRLSDPIPLTVSHMFKQSLKPQTQNVQEQYVFYSLTAFNLTFHMISGSISVVMIDPQRNYAIYQTVSQTKTFGISAVDYKSKQKIEFYSSQALYRILIIALRDTEFYLHLERNRATQRIFEGYPVTVTVKQNTPNVIQFVNSQAADKPITLMANIGQIDNNTGSALDVSIDFQVQLDSDAWLSSQQVVTNIIVGEQTIVYNLKNVAGTYFINITSNLHFNVTFLLFQNQLTHLTPAANHLFDKEGIFQLTSNDQHVMVEIFNCRGDLTVAASNNYQAIVDATDNTSLITLKRPNYAGHYVFAVQDGLGSYFLKVSNKKQTSELQYLIDYYYTDGKNPYDSIDALNYDVVYARSTEGLVITVNAPLLLSSGDFLIKNVSYWAYAATNEQNLERYSRCAVYDNVFSFPANSSSFFISNVLIDSYLSPETAASDSLFLNVEASLHIEMIAPQGSQPGKYPSVLTILYNTIELPIQRLGTSPSYAYWFTDSLLFFVVWMLLPFFLAGLALAYLLKCCLRKLMMRQRDMVEEVDVKGTTQTIPDAGKTEGYLSKSAQIERVVQQTF